MAHFSPAELLGKYSNTYIIDNMSDYNILQQSAKELNIDVPNCIIKTFAQEKSSMWSKIIPDLDENLPAVVCNTMLDCITDEEKNDVCI